MPRRSPAAWASSSSARECVRFVPSSSPPPALLVRQPVPALCPPCCVSRPPPYPFALRLGQVATALRRLKNTCYKVDIHLMPNLPGSSAELDRVMFENVLSDPDLQADQWKVYPTQVPAWPRRGTGEGAGHGQRRLGEQRRGLGGAFYGPHAPGWGFVRRCTLALGAPNPPGRRPIAIGGFLLLPCFSTIGRRTSPHAHLLSPMCIAGGAMDHHQAVV